MCIVFILTFDLVLNLDKTGAQYSQIWGALWMTLLILLYNELCTNFAQYIRKSRQSVTWALSANGWLRSNRPIRKVSETHFPS
jgi:hypothetical protein